MGALVDDAVEKLRMQGGRMTSQRKMILETLEDLEGHPTAEELFAVASRRDANLNLSTVYRTLRWLEQEGLVSARRFDEARGVERFDAASPVEHQHFVCTECKKVIEFDQPLIRTIKARFSVEHGCLVDSASVTLYGVCSNCIRLKPNKEII